MANFNDRTLEEWNLTPSDIKAAPKRSGQVVRDKTLAAGEKVGGATNNARIVPDDAEPPPFKPSATPPAWTYAHFSKVRRKDVARSIMLALAQPSDGECSVLNIVVRQPDLAVSMDQLLATWHPRLALKNMHAAAFSNEAAERCLGFTADWP